MGEPDLAGEGAGRDTYRCSGDYIAYEMPITYDQKYRRNKQQCREWQDHSIESHENTCEGAGEDHVARGKAAVPRAGQETECMTRSVQHGPRVRYPEKDLQNAVVDRISTDGSQARERSRLAQTRQMSARYPNADERKRNGRFDTEKYGTSEAFLQALS